MRFAAASHPARDRRGYTLAELLVVIVILGILVAVALPVARSVMDESKPREASRQLNSYFAMARTRAAATGRPWGVWMDLAAPLGETNSGPISTGGPPSPPRYIRQATQFYLAEVPPAYGGGSLGARGRIHDSSDMGTGPNVFEVVIPNSSGSPPYIPDPAETPLLLSLINDGEDFVVRFDYRGKWFTCRRSGTNLVWTGTVSGVNVSPPGGLSASNPGTFFQIVRSPRRVGNPLEITAGTCVDLCYSGFGPTGNQFSLASNMLCVMFMPGGSVEGVYRDGSLVGTSGTLHFLVGRTSKMNDPLGTSTHVSGRNFFDPEKSNLADTGSLWVSIGRQTGAVTTTENLPDANHGSHSDPWSTTGMQEFLEESREAATGREQMGGK